MKLTSYASAPSCHYLARSRRLLRNHDTLVQWVQHLGNAFIVALSLLALAYWRDGFVGSHYRSMLVIAVLLMFITYRAFGVHRKFDSLLGGTYHLARAWGVVVIVLVWLAFLTKTSEVYSRQVVVYWVVLAFVGQALIFFLTYKLYNLYQEVNGDYIPALIVGTGPVACHLTRSINKNIWLHDRIVAAMTYGGDGELGWDFDQVPVISDETDLTRVVEAYRIKRVYLALPLSNTHLIQHVQETLANTNVDVIWAPDIFALNLLNHSVREISGVPLITLNETPLLEGGPAFIKNVMDRVIAAHAVVLLSPLLIAVALLVKLTSPGPILFKQIRDGWDGRKFYVYKFRSMYVQEDQGMIKQAKKNDSRVTPLGRFIRRTSIDELPQLFNVLQGTMSLVGPRPHAVPHNQFYSDKVKAYLARHRVKPGMTGLAQINGLRGETGTLEAMSRRVECDLYYISNWSPLLDLKILWFTPWCLFSKNAY